LISIYLCDDKSDSLPITAIDNISAKITSYDEGRRSFFVFDKATIQINGHAMIAILYSYRDWPIPQKENYRSFISSISDDQDFIDGAFEVYTSFIAIHLKSELFKQNFRFIYVDEYNESMKLYNGKITLTRSGRFFLTIEFQIQGNDQKSLNKLKMLQNTFISLDELFPKH